MVLVPQHQVELQLLQISRQRTPTAAAMAAAPVGVCW
jgi:hypothetical protein